MINGLGIDIVENKRIKTTQQFIDKVLSQKEKKLLMQITNKQQKKEFLAGRWAVKEALYKADIVFPFPAIAVLQDLKDKLFVEINNKKQEKIYVSLSHEKKMTIAVAIKII